MVRLSRWLLPAAVAMVLANAPLLERAALGQKVKSQSLQGVVQSIASDGSFIMDNNGAPAVVYTDAATTFQFDKNNSTFAETVRVGLSVKASVASDGTATQVTSKTPKTSTSNTANTPGIPNAPKASAIDQLQLALGASDEEWQILRPLIEDILSLQSQIGSAVVALKSVQPPTLSLEDTKAELTTRRDAHARLTEQLTKDRTDLTKLITVRQELILVQLGIIE